MEIKTEGKGLVLPPGSVKAKPYGKSTMNIEVVRVETMQPLTEPVPYDVPIVTVVYPDGYLKNYEAASITDLLAKIGNTLRYKYGAVSFDIASIPDDLAPSIIKLKGIIYG